MEGKNKRCSSHNVVFSDSEDDDYDDVQESETELDLCLEKLNLGPKKKLLVLNLNGLLLHRVNRRDMKGIPKSRRANGIYRNFFRIYIYIYSQTQIYTRNSHLLLLLKLFFF